MADHILVIDDDTGIVQALKIRLAASGYTVTTATDGRGGLDAAERARPDLILLDIRLPDIDGFEVSRCLREITHLADIPIIFISANVRDQARDHAYAAGGAAFIPKPYDAAEVIATVKRILSRRVSTPNARGAEA